MDHPNAHLLQTGAWGDLKSEFGWQAERVIEGGCGAQILFRQLPFGFTFAYIPKGPVGTSADWHAFWGDIDRVCRRQGSVLLKVEPDLNEPLPPEAMRAFAAFQPSDPVQPRRTILVDLSGGEEAWLERMKQKTRYNIRLAQKKEVLVRPSDDLEGFYRLMETTGERDAFGIHSLDYYRRAYELFHARGQCVLLVAEYAGRLLAGLMAFAQGTRAWYLYGASNDEERSRMPTYLLQFEAMRWAYAQGCQAYDLVGVPDEDEASLEEQFTSRSDGLWGVYRFKRGFGGRLVRSAGAFDRAYLPFAAELYRWWRSRRGGGE